MLRPGFGLLNISTQERGALGSSPGRVSKQGPGASWHLFYLKICQQLKCWDTSPEDGDFFFFFSLLVNPEDGLAYLLHSFSSSYWERVSTKGGRQKCWVHLELSPFLKWLPSETTFSRTVLSGTLFLTGTILQVCKTISVIPYYRRNTTVPNTTARWWNGQTTISHRKLGPLPPMSGWAAYVGELNTCAWPGRGAGAQSRAVRARKTHVNLSTVTPNSASYENTLSPSFFFWKNGIKIPYFLGCIKDEIKYYIESTWPSVWPREKLIKWSSC